MKLMIVRHAIAQDRSVFAKTSRKDSERPLTKEGKTRMLKNAKGMSKQVQAVDFIISSPLKRAMQTAQILKEQFPHAPILVTDSLKPDADPEKFKTYLEKSKFAFAAATLIAVGHEPQLSILSSWIMSASKKPMFIYKKGGAALFKWAHPYVAGSAELCWFLRPLQLRRQR